MAAMLEAKMMNFFKNIRIIYKAIQQLYVHYITSIRPWISSVISVIGDGCLIERNYSMTYNWEHVRTVVHNHL